MADTARIKKKMLYSSSFDALKKCLVGVQNIFRPLMRQRHLQSKLKKNCVQPVVFRSKEATDTVEQAQLLAWRSSWLIRGIEISLCILKPTCVFSFFLSAAIKTNPLENTLLDPPVFVKF